MLSRNGTLWNLVFGLSREPLEIDQICQLQKVCLVEEQSIIEVFHSTKPGSCVILDDITNAVEEWKPIWTLYLHYLENY